MKKYIPFFIQNIFIVLSIILAYFFLPKILIVLAPFLTAFIITRIFNPVIERIEKVLKNRILISFFITLFVVFVIGGLLYLIIFACISLFHMFASSLPDILEDCMETITFLFEKIENHEALNKIDGLLNINLVDIDAIELLINDKIITFIDFLSNKSIDIATSSFKYVWPVFLYVLFTLLATYLMIVNKDQIYSKIRKFIGNDRTDKIKYFYNRNIEILFKFIKAQVKISFFIFLLIFIYLSVFRIKYVFLLAVITTIVDILPILGAGSVLCPLSIIYFISGEYKLSISYIVLYLIILVFRQLIQPKIISDEIGIDALTSLVIMYAGYVLYGFVGMLCAVPIYVVFKNLYESCIFDSYIKYLKMIKNDILKIIKN